MTYDETRDSEQLRLLTPAIDAFIGRYRNPPPSTSTCPRQTVFFFPGGMASQLKRATAPYQDGGPANQQFNYETIWLTFESFLGEALNLQMHRDAEGAFRDKDDRIIVADDVVGFLDCTPHDGFVTWCSNNNLDLFVFPWDWRRRLDDAAAFFVGKFLPFFQNRVVAAGSPDPLAKFSLVGHSFGGMVVNLILRGEHPMVANMDKAVTVATPFYGYASQAHRWFEGEHLLNGPLNVFKKRMVKAISSMPALYTVLFLDQGTYNNSTIRAALAADPLYPLNAYPSIDATTATAADPYNPQSNGNLVRYPASTGFDNSELDYAELLIRHLGAPMASHLMQKFFHIRGVRPVNDTVGSVTCGWIAPNFNPLLDASPIVDGPVVPGDDTQPAFTARLATNSAQSMTVAGSDVQHAFIMNSVKTHDALATILCAQGAAMTPPAPPQSQQPASSAAQAVQAAPAREKGAPAPSPQPEEQHATAEEALAFAHWLHKTYMRGKKKRTVPLDVETVLKDAPPEFRARLGHIARRIMMDIMKRPAPRKDAPAPGSPPRGPGAPPTTKGKGKKKAKVARPRTKAAKVPARRRGRPGKK